jgi:uncharacterized iron-regulated membrane protein
VNPPLTRTVPAKKAAKPPSPTVRTLRALRPLHRWVGVPLTLFILMSGITGAVLGWKKNAEILQPENRRGASADLRDWRPWHEVNEAAILGLAGHLPADERAGIEVDRYDVRPGHGVVKVQFTRRNWEVQVDPVTLEVLNVARRHSDWIEQVHDLSIISDNVKLVSMNILGLGLVVLSLSGLWLWYGPLRLRRQKPPHA